MPEFNHSEAETEGHRIRRRRLILGAALLPAGLLGAFVLSHLWQTYFLIDPSIAWFVSWGVMAIPVVLIFGKLEARFWPDDPDVVRRLVQRDQETIQRGRSRQAALIVLLLALTLVLSIINMLHPGMVKPGFADVRWLLPVFVLVFVPEILGVQFMKTIHAAMNDELTRFLRARALSIGYVVVVVATVLVYVGSLYQRDVAAFGVPVVLFLAVAVPTVFFAVFERRAGGLE